jgi:hypothetical protein
MDHAVSLMSFSVQSTFSYIVQKYEFFSTKYIFLHSAKMSPGTDFFFLKFQNRNHFLTEKDILNAIPVHKSLKMLLVIVYSV